MKTLLEVLRGATDYLGRRQIESPRLNAEHIIAHALGRKRLDLYLEFDRPLNETELAPLREQFRQRGEGVPLQHLLGTAEFHGRTFGIDGRALIPRPETERLVELILERRADSPPNSILDIGTGSGVIALTLAAEWPQARVIATDLSPDALALAAENRERMNLAERVTFVEIDGFPAAGHWDLVVSNPPYIPSAEIAALQREVQADPRIALDGGSDGMQILEAIIGQGPQHLAPGGVLALEIGHGQSERLLDKMRSAGYVNASAEADYQGIDRFLFAYHG